MKEAVENCWALCVRCDHDKTNNKPTHVFWLHIWLRQVAIHGYVEEVEKAKAAIQFHTTKAQLKKGLG